MQEYFSASLNTVTDVNPINQQTDSLMVVQKFLNQSI